MALQKQTRKKMMQKWDSRHPSHTDVKVLRSDLDQKVIQNGAQIHTKSIEKCSKNPSEKQLENLMKKQ